MLAKQQAARQGNPAKAWAVVKADAYGHGLLRVARALDDIADGFALLEMDAAVVSRMDTLWDSLFAKRAGPGLAGDERPA